MPIWGMGLGMTDEENSKSCDGIRQARIES